MTKNNALAYLDGGPAAGLTIELEEPEWAPLRAIRIDVAGMEQIYVRVTQRRPTPGSAWRYVPQGSADDPVSDEDDGVVTDPFDD